VTDCNLMLGKIQPKILSPGVRSRGDAPLDDAVVRAKFAALAARSAAPTGDTRTPEQVAEGFVEIAVGNMAEAIKKISVQRGHDVTEYTLCCFGGAAGQQRLPRRRRARYGRACSSIRSPGFSPPTAWARRTRTAMREEAVEVELEADKRPCSKARSRSCPGRRRRN